MEAANEYDDNILLSTLWDQSGAIPCGDNETKGTDAINFNKYSPKDLITDNLSYTGCANTAMGQVIYYFLENDMLPDYNFTLNALDTYVSYGNVPIRATVINHEGGGSAETHSFVAINKLISEFVSVPTNPKATDYSLQSEKAADFIAAFNFACGVVNRSDFSDIAGTGAIPNISLYNRCGFKSVVSTETLSPEESKRFWNEENNKLTDEAFEIFIENLHAGRPILVCIPGHAVVLDGYDPGDSEGDEDKFHINYGWGTENQGSESEGSAKSTRWYTRQEFSDLNVDLLHFDLYGEYIEEFTVSDNRFYGTGTFLRALEQANGMTGDNIITFTDDMKDRVIAESPYQLPYQYEMSQGILLKDFNAVVFNSIATEPAEVTPPPADNPENNQEEKETKKRFMFVGNENSCIKFENFNGSAMIQTSSGTDGIIFEFSNSVRTDLFFNGTKLYSAKYAGEINADNVKTVIQAVTEQDTAALLPELEGSYVIIASNNDDVIKFENASFAAGNIELGAGRNKLIINDASEIIGNIAGEGQNAVYIDNSSTITGTIEDATGIFISINGQNSDAVFNITGEAEKTLQNILAVTIDASEADIGEYTLFSWQSQLNDILEQLNCKIIGNGQLVEKENSIVLQVENKNTLFKLPEEWKIATSRAGNVVTVNWDEIANIAGYCIRYAQDEAALAGSGIAVSTNSTDLTLNNGTWYFQIRAVDKNGAYSEWSSAATITFENNDETIADHYIANATATDKTIDSDFTVMAGGTLKDAEVTSGILNLEAGSITTGTFNIGKNATVNAGSGAQFVFDLSSLERANSKAMINNLDAVNGSFIYSINVSEKQTLGTYILANNVTAWDTSTISVKAEDITLGTFSETNPHFFYGDNIYVLLHDERKKQLQLVIDDSIDTAYEDNGSTKLTWHAPRGADGYIVELSGDNKFSSRLQLTTKGNQLCIVTPLSKSYSWRTMTVGYDTEFTPGERIKTGRASADAKVYVGADDSNMTNIYFAKTSGVWGRGYYAGYMTENESMKGIVADVALKGKNRYQDIFIGDSYNADILYLTDDSNGDAFFADDIFTAFPDKQDQIRFANINDIYAGAGNDIIDMTSLRYMPANEKIVIHGGDGDDVIWGAPGNFLFGDNGNDTIIGSAADDHFSGGAGDDYLHGGGGKDCFLYGDPDTWGNDVIYQAPDGSIHLVFLDYQQENIIYSYDETDNITTITHKEGSGSITIYGYLAEKNMLPSRHYSSVDLAFTGFYGDSSQKIFNDIDTGMLA